MPVTERISVDVPSDIADAMRAQIAAGRYATESDAVTEALRFAYDEDEATEAWLRSEIAPAIDEIRAGRATLLTSDEIRDRLGLKR